MKRPLLFAGLVTLLLLTMGCKEEFDPYAKPEWLTGKIYQQLEARDDLSTFKKCVDSHKEFSDILKRTNLLTVFAPNDDAFQKYFQEHPQYNNFEDIPLNVVRGLVESHIIFDAWNSTQLTITDERGKIDETTTRDRATAFKKRTVFRDSARTVDVLDYNDPLSKFDHNHIVRSGLSTSKRKLIPTDNKYVPVFFQAYFDEFDLSSDDYEFYYKRPFEGGDNLYYAGGKLIEKDIPAENGFVHVIDRVVPPLPNLEQKMENSVGQVNDYSKFLDLIRSYTYMIPNTQETNRLPGFAEGQVKPEDYLFNLLYAFDIGLSISRENTGYFSSTGNLTLVNHTGFVAPNNEAFDKMVDEITGFPKWSNFSIMPDNVKFLLINAHMSREAIYKHDIDQGFTNLSYDSVYINESAIAETEFCSNGTFIGLKDPIIPRAFSSIAGPVYLFSNYSMYQLLAEEMGVISALKNPYKRMSLFVVSDSRVTEDSSLVVIETSRDLYINGLAVGSFPRYEFRYFDLTDDDAKKKSIPFTDSDLGFLLNMVCEGEPKGIANYEWLRTIVGNYVLFDNINNTVQGSDPSTFGFGDSSIVNTPRKLDFDADNGSVYELAGWLNFKSTTPIFSVIKQLGKTSGLSNYFYELLETADLVDLFNVKLNFMAEGQFHTIFMPTNAALIEYENIIGNSLKNLPKAELQQFLKFHFVQGELIFTDGNKLSGEYKTLRKTKGSNAFNTYYATLDLQTAPDEINILDKKGSPYVTVRPRSGKTNIMTYTLIDSESNEENKIYSPHYTSGIVHSIDQVLVYEQK